MLSNITLQESGRSQTDKVNFKFDIDNLIVLNTNEIPINSIKTFVTGKTNGLPNNNYKNSYITEKGKNSGNIKFLLQITKLSDTDKDKIKEIYLQAYYINDVKLKIRFSKVIFTKLFLRNTNYNFLFFYSGNDKDIILDISNPNVLGIRNKNYNPVKITIKPR